MFAFLRGSVATKGLHHVELDVNGAGYEVFAPTGVLNRLQRDQPVTLRTYCHIREDSFQIFGFLHEEEKALFKTLLSVSGVGPRMALAILSTMSAPEFGAAVMDNDVTAFTRVPGVGKKTAQRLVLEMKAKAGQDGELNAILGEPEGAGTGPASDDVTAALCSLGCTLPEARKAAETARKTLGADAPEEELVKAALRTLAKA